MPSARSPGREEARPIPPQNPQAERAVLASMILDPDAARAALEIVTPEKFYSVPHRLVCHAIARLIGRAEPVDLITLKEELRRLGKLEAVGGADFLQSILDDVPVIANVQQHARIVRNAYLLRKLIAAISMITETAYAAATDPCEILHRAESDEALRPVFVALGEVIDGSASGSAVEPIELVDLSGETTPPRWITPGWIALGEVGVLAGDISEGKTTLAVDQCWSIATGRPWLGITPEITGPVIYFAEECSADEIRLLFQRLGGDHPNLHVAAEQGLRLDDPAQVARIEALIDKVQPVFIVFDTWRAILAGDENDSGSAADCARILRQFVRRRKGDCAIEALHHLRKRQEREPWGMNLLRGSTALPGFVPFVVAIRRDPLDPAVTQLHRWKRRGRSLKPHYLFRYVAEDGDITPIELVGIGLAEEDVQPSPTAKTRAAGVARNVLDERGPIGSGEIEAIGERFHVNARTMQRAILHLKKTGTILQEPGKGGRLYLPGQESAL